MKHYSLSILFALFVTFSFSQSKIKKAEESLKKNKNTSIKTTSTTSRHKTSSYTDGGFLENTFGRFFAELFLYTTYGTLIESPFEGNDPNRKASLTKHPYFNSNNGNYTYKKNESFAIGRTTISSRYFFENSRIDGNHLNIDIRFFNRLALEVNYLQLWENNTNFGNHSLAIYTSLIKYHRVRSQKFDAWWGLGASYTDGNIDELGFTYGLGAEVFLGKPISLESNFNQTLINNETINKFNGFLNYYISQYKIIGGYESLKIGSQKFSNITFGLGVSF